MYFVINLLYNHSLNCLQSVEKVDIFKVSLHLSRFYSVFATFSLYFTLYIYYSVNYTVYKAFYSTFTLQTLYQISTVCLHIPYTVFYTVHKGFYSTFTYLYSVTDSTCFFAHKNFYFSETTSQNNLILQSINYILIVETMYKVWFFDLLRDLDFFTLFLTVFSLYFYTMYTVQYKVLLNHCLYTMVQCFYSDSIMKVLYTYSLKYCHFDIIHLV